MPHLAQHSAAKDKRDTNNTSSERTPALARESHRRAVLVMTFALTLDHGHYRAGLFRCSDGLRRGRIMSRARRQ